MDGFKGAMWVGIFEKNKFTLAKKSSNQEEQNILVTKN